MKTLLPLLTIALTASASAASLVNWKQLNSGISPATSGLNTDSPTYGDGSSNNAVSVFVAGQFASTVSLSVGETLTVTGSYVLTGGSGVADQYRHGIYNDGGAFAADDPNNWTAGFIHEPTDDIFRARTDGAYLSTAANAAPLGATKLQSGTWDADSVAAYTFTMSITRDTATTVDIVSSLVGGDGSYDQTYTVDDHVTTNFDFTTFGFLVGGSSSQNQISFSGVEYTVIPEPSTFFLSGIGVFLLMRRRRN